MAESGRVSRGLLPLYLSLNGLGDQAQPATRPVFSPLCTRQRSRFREWQEWSASATDRRRPCFRSSGCLRLHRPVPLRKHSGRASHCPGAWIDALTRKARIAPRAHLASQRCVDWTRHSIDRVQCRAHDGQFDLLGPRSPSDSEGRMPCRLLRPARLWARTDNVRQSTQSTYV